MRDLLAARGSLGRHWEELKGPKEDRCSMSKRGAQKDQKGQKGPDHQSFLGQLWLTPVVLIVINSTPFTLRSLLLIGHL